MMCARCDEPITPGAAEEIPQYGASGSGGIVHVHRDGCPTDPPEATRPRTWTYRSR